MIDILASLGESAREFDSAFILTYRLIWSSTTD